MSTPPMSPVPITGFPMGNYPISNITPLTYRDASTFLEMLESLSAWLLTTLVPHVDEQNAALVTAWSDEITAFTDTMNAALTAQANTVNERMTANEAEINQTVADLIASAMINDTIMRDVFANLTSLFRVALDAEYVNVGERGVANGVATLDAGIKVPDAQLKRGVANGLATLDAGIKVPVAQLPTNVNDGILGLGATGKAAVAQLPVNVNSGILGLDAGGKAAIAQLPVNINNGILGLDSGGKAAVAQLPAGTANGVATLGADTKLPVAQLGTVRVTENAVPLDASLAAGQAIVWFDMTAGAAKLMVRAKNASGTAVSGSVALT